MSIHINPDLCCGDELCLKVCPVNCFTMIANPLTNQENKKHTKTTKNKETKAQNIATLTKSAHLTCILCGQCVAICPKSAIVMDKITHDPTRSMHLKHDSHAEQEECTSTQEKTLSSTLTETSMQTCSEANASKIEVTREQFIALAKNRRSIRHFKEKPVPLDIIRDALDMARYAPTAKNCQGTEWVIVDGREKVQELNSIIMDFMRPNPLFKRLVQAYDQGLDPICRGASTLIFAHCLSDLPTKFGEVDCTIAITHLDLFFPTIGLGTCWAGYIVGASKIYPPIKEFLNVPENHTVYTGLMLGYPTYKYKKIPQRKPLSLQIIN